MDYIISQTRGYLIGGGIFFGLLFLLVQNVSGNDLGLVLGASNSTFFEEDNEDWKSRLGFNGGMFFTWTWRDSANFRFEFNYKQRGGMINGDNYSIDVALDYFEIAILAGLVPRETPNLRVIFGPSFSWVRSGYITADLSQLGISKLSEDIAPEDVHPDIGVVVGLNYLFNHFLFGVRYTWGMQRILNEEKYGMYDLDLYNRALDFGIGFYF